MFDNYRKTGVSNIFVSVCRCQPQKNIPRLVRCFNKVISKYPDTLLLIIGGGYDNEIGILAKKSACSGIIFLGLKHNVVDFFKCADFFTLSSDYEGMPITLIEALSVGCIPVGTPVSGFNDIIKDEVNGFVAHDFGDDSYIKAIENAINNKQKINKDLLISTYKEKLSIESCANSYIKLFELSKYSKQV
ncbi:glycosyltransferase family 4 protein [Segatella paludivivens]|uniref:glycosyltransferase family 4 protein n=1 Tax=Segatella paludivivens TaxID=185294 RepID=UPI0021CFB19D|nr:glycosyltransferase family 4 protein [Segatella paludivivens]